MAATRHLHRLSRRRLLAASTLSAVPFIAPPRLLAQTPASTPEPAAGPAGFGPQLYVSAAEVRFDEAFDIGVAGLQPGSEVTIRSDFTDAEGQAWSAGATWLADGYGNVWCSGSAPVIGSH